MDGAARAQEEECVDADDVLREDDQGQVVREVGSERLLDAVNRKDVDVDVF